MHEGYFGGQRSSYWLTRFVLLRALGFIYAVAFLMLVNQLEPLIGSDGLMPAAAYMEGVREHRTFWRYPTIWGDTSDGALLSMAWLGLTLSLLVLAGAQNALLMAVLWFLSMSFNHVGQTFWGYGWEILLLEAGFLAIFLCPVGRVMPWADPSPPPLVVIWLYRWLIFRVMFGAGLIKLRGDNCWTDLTCLVYHYETQPNPHPLSWLLHQMPVWFHKAGVAFNHVVELIVPWFAFGPRTARHVAGGFLVAFQCMLILSGNLSFLNWLTLVIALACFDDSALRRVLPARLVERADRLAAAENPPNRPRMITSGALAVVVAVLSMGPVFNMIGSRQQMNASFDPYHLVNTYGAFGSVGQVRHEVILQGTTDAKPDAEAQWREYEFKCKPGDVTRRPCLITPYHLRIDWQMWFAALGSVEREPWILNLIYKLLSNERGVLSLIERNPFGDKPPRYIRAELYRYEFTTWGEAGWWKRIRVDSYLGPVHAEHPDLLRYLRRRGWIQ